MDTRYEVIIYWSAEDQVFIAEAPELPGCMADGKTHRDALTNLELVMNEWIETAIQLGREIPEPPRPADVRLTIARNDAVLARLRRSNRYRGILREPNSERIRVGGHEEKAEGRVLQRGCCTEVHPVTAQPSGAVIKTPPPQRLVLG